MRISTFIREASSKQYINWTLFSALAGALSIVLHEIGHALMALVLGYSHVRITYHSVDRVAPIDIQPWEKALTSEAGPIASLIIIIICYTVLRLWKPNIFIQALGMLAAVQFLGGTVYVIGALFGANPPTDFDSARFAQYLNISIIIPSLIEAISLIGSWILFIRLIAPPQRIIAVLGVISGGTLGIIIWLFLIGPLLLP